MAHCSICKSELHYSKDAQVWFCPIHDMIAFMEPCVKRMENEEKNSLKLYIKKT
jgi:uncharacterized Zn finger protein (UPF0148 family)